VSTIQKDGSVPSIVSLSSSLAALYKFGSAAKTLAPLHTRRRREECYHIVYLPWFELAGKPNHGQAERIKFQDLHYMVTVVVFTIDLNDFASLLSTRFQEVSTINIRSISLFSSFWK
jgi:hypothetical protein